MFTLELRFKAGTIDGISWPAQFRKSRHDENSCEERNDKIGRPGNPVACERIFYPFSRGLYSRTTLSLLEAKSRLAMNAR